MESSGQIFSVVVDVSASATALVAAVSLAIVIIQKYLEKHRASGVPSDAYPGSQQVEAGTIPNDRSLIEEYVLLKATSDLVTSPEGVERLAGTYKDKENDFIDLETALPELREKR